MDRSIFPQFLHRKIVLTSAALLMLLTGAGALRWLGVAADIDAVSSAVAAETRVDEPEASSSATVQLAPEHWDSSGIELQAAGRGRFSRTVLLTGQIGLNEDRVAHIFPMVEGIVDSVHVQLGQRVKAGDLLLVIQSREVGRAKLELYQARLLHEVAQVKNQRTLGVAKNTGELIEALRNEASIETIEDRFRDRPMGDYRQQLLAAYAKYYKSQADVERLASLGDSGAVAAKRFVSATAVRNADRATFQASLEQIRFDLESAVLVSSQDVKETETRVAVAETSLKILGYDEQALLSINPAKEGETISHYPVRAPFDGTVLSKDAALLEHARPDAQLLSIADLSTVWLKADVYEKHLPLLQSLAGETVTVRNEAWPDRVFEAQVFYTGDVMDQSTRTIGMRAVADNQEGLLKPGMFVNVELPEMESGEVIQVPNAAIQEHESQPFVFVHKGGHVFERRDVKIGRATQAMTEVLEGIEADETVVVSGGFVLKSRMLADLMSGD